MHTPGGKNERLKSKNNAGLKRSVRNDIRRLLPKRRRVQCIVLDRTIVDVDHYMRIASTQTIPRVVQLRSSDSDE